MNIMFRRKVIRVYADIDTVIKALKETASVTALNFITNTFSGSLFHYHMRVTRDVEGVIAPIYISGTVETRGDYCIIRYYMRPIIIEFIGPVLVTFACLCDFIINFQNVVTWWPFAVVPLFWLILFLQIPWRETVCEERIIKKLIEVDRHHDVDFPL